MFDITSIPKRLATLSTHRTYSMPIVVLMPHSRCNCRCVMCDIWKANKNKQEISYEDLQKQVDSFQKLGVKWVVMSGGEALMHSNLWRLCELLKDYNIKISLLSTGLLLKQHRDSILENCDDVVVSLDGSEEVHNQIRNIPQAFQKLAEGVAALKELNPKFRITGRSVLQRANYQDFPNIIKAAHAIGLDQISFLAADVSSEAFNRPDGWDGEKVAQVGLSLKEAEAFEKIIEETIVEFGDEFKRKFVSESPEKIRRLAQYYKALHGEGDFPETFCNAPWVSTVIETNGDVLPCFFHKPLGNIYQNDLKEILNAKNSINFRKNLNVKTDPICQKCVCSLSLGVTSQI